MGGVGGGLLEGGGGVEHKWKAVRVKHRTFRALHTKKLSVITYLKRSTYTFRYVTKDFFLCLFVSCER